VAPAKAFGRALRARRRAASLTQENLGFEADLTRVFVSWLERGKKQPTITTVLKLAAALRCSAAELVADMEAQMGGDTQWRVDSLAAPVANDASNDIATRVGSQGKRRPRSPARPKAVRP
jgi:transcriptional regulator with XRE-family HTH domain